MTTNILIPVNIGIQYNKFFIYRSIIPFSSLSAIMYNKFVNTSRSFLCYCWHHPHGHQTESLHTVQYDTCFIFGFTRFHDFISYVWYFVLLFLIERFWLLNEYYCCRYLQNNKLSGTVPSGLLDKNLVLKWVSFLFL